MSKLNQGELLEELDHNWMNPYTENSPRWKHIQQAYQQIRELIQKPGVTGEFIEAKACEMIVVILHGMKKDAIAFIQSLLKEAK